MTPKLCLVPYSLLLLLHAFTRSENLCTLSLRPLLVQLPPPPLFLSQSCSAPGALSSPLTRKSLNIYIRIPPNLWIQTALIGSLSLSLSVGATNFLIRLTNFKFYKNGCLSIELSRFDIIQKMAWA